MDCADCALKLERGVAQLPGVEACTVSFATTRMVLDFDPALLDRSQVERRVRVMGYGVAAGDRDPAIGADSDGPGILRRARARPRETLTGLAGLLILLAFATHLLGLPAAVTNGLYGLAMVCGGYFVARKAVSSLRYSRELDINVLMTIAVIGAAAIGEWPEGALVVFLFSLGETLEGYTMDRARSAVRSLMAVAPAQATVLRPCMDCQGHLGRALPNGALYESGPCPWCEPHELLVPIEELAVGEIVLVRPGERVPVDGQVRKGQSTINQAPITGESVPVDKGPRDDVFAGTINGTGVLQIEVTRLAADTTLSRIIHMVEEAQAQKAHTQRWVDTFARIYTPAVVGIALLIALVPPLLFSQPFLSTSDATGWLYRALALLVIACPCALVISTPVSIVSAISAAARQGILFKGGAYLEAIARVRAMAFDKTGTLTVGRPSLTVAQCMGHKDHEAALRCEICEDVLALAAAVERRSEHPLATAIVQAAEDRQLNRRYSAATDVHAVAGKGIHGWINGQEVAVSSHRHVHDMDICGGSDFCHRVTSLEAAGQTTMLLHDGNGLRGYLAVADQVRPQAAKALEELRQEGVGHLVMLTGDNETTAQAVAALVGVDEARANLLPGDKVGVIEEMLARFGDVAMVGDGINDAPALARATVGIAMGSAGTDQALETADVALMGDDLSLIPFAVRLSKATRLILIQNIGLSLLIKSIFLILAIQGQATLWMAVFADVGASLIVILNGMRLLRKRPE